MTAFDTTDLLTHDQKILFIQELDAALDLRQEDGKDVWNCYHNHSHARRILGEMGLDVEKIVTFFEKHGGFCDCEIIFNVIGAEEIGDDEQPS